MVIFRPVRRARRVDEVCVAIEVLAQSGAASMNAGVSNMALSSAAISMSITRCRALSFQEKELAQRIENTRLGIKTARNLVRRCRALGKLNQERKLSQRIENTRLGIKTARNLVRSLAVAMAAGYRLCTFLPPEAFAPIQIV